MKVLIVDDEAPARDRLAHMLTSIDDVQAAGEASNGIEAVEMVQSARPDVVLMDIRMPVMGGIEAVKTLREQQVETPIIALTANAMKEDREQCYKAGCDGFLSKPVDVLLLTETLEKYLENVELSA